MQRSPWEETLFHLLLLLKQSFTALGDSIEDLCLCGLSEPLSTPSQTLHPLGTSMWHAAFNCRMYSCLEWRCFDHSGTIFLKWLRRPPHNWGVPASWLLPMVWWEVRQGVLNPRWGHMLTDEPHGCLCEDISWHSGTEEAGFLPQLFLFQSVREHAPVSAPPCTEVRGLDPFVCTCTVVGFWHTHTTPRASPSHHPLSHHPYLRGVKDKLQPPHIF